jgi:hypothetical protein
MRLMQMQVYCRPPLVGLEITPLKEPLHIHMSATVAPVIYKFFKQVAHIEIVI